MRLLMVRFAIPMQACNSKAERSQHLLIEMVSFNIFMLTRNFDVFSYVKSL